jgi:type I restriction enzyme, S subunit
MAVGRECKSEELKMKNEELKDKSCKSGYKMTELGEIPEDWEVRKFKDVSKISQGLQIAIEDRFKEQGLNRLPYITIQYINDKSDYDNQYYIEDANKSVICTRDDILMTRTGNTGVVITNEYGVFHNNFFKVDYKKDILNKNFLVYYLKSNTIQRLILRYAGTTTIPDLKHGDFYKIPVIIPKIEEQQKIASILSSVDEQIEITDSLIEKTKELKKGLMQRLLTKGIGHSKFKDTEIGRIPVEWEVVQIKEIVKVGPQNGIYKNNKYYCGNKFNIVALKDLYRNYKFINLDELQFIDLNDNEIKLYGLKQGDILINRVSKAVDGVGRMRIVGQLKNIICFESNMMRITLESSKANTEYIYYLSEGDMFRNEIMKVAKDSNQSSISQSDISNIKIALPSIEEQTQIAKILSSVDEQIDQYESKKEKLKELKKGLMQKLLTGKIRVKV